MSSEVLIALYGQLLPGEIIRCVSGEQNWRVGFKTRLLAIFCNTQQAPPKEGVGPGVLAVANAIRLAYERAKERGLEDPKGVVLVYMNNKRDGASHRPLVRFLIKNDTAFEPGEWYTESKLSICSNHTPFKHCVLKVVKHTEGFEWASWRSS